MSGCRYTVLGNMSVMGKCIRKALTPLSNYGHPVILIASIPYEADLRDVHRCILSKSTQWRHSKEIRTRCGVAGASSTGNVPSGTAQAREAQDCLEKDEPRCLCHVYLSWLSLFPIALPHSASAFLQFSLLKAFAIQITFFPW